ncbi:uncharacterized protein LOC141849097 [Brevipalpus obovatus]|uniref:uncharacterized protein LOC141849097 n=1 Tax=Brevipalpus obovatus TaxID=246614 RepID=UPI003D9E9BF9
MMSLIQGHLKVSSCLLVCGLGTYFLYCLVKRSRRGVHKFSSCIPEPKNDVFDSPIEDETNPKSLLTSPSVNVENSELRENEPVPQAVNEQVETANGPCLQQSAQPCSFPPQVTGEEKDSEQESNKHEITDLIENTMDFSYPLSMTSSSSELGGCTMAKLDQILEQAKYLRKSVSEINADFVNVRRGTRFPGADSSILSLASSNFSPEHRTLEDSDLSTNERFFSPSLEWDSNGLNCSRFSFSENSNIESSINSVNESSVMEPSELSFGLSSDDSGTSSNSTIEEPSTRQATNTPKSRRKFKQYEQRDVSSFDLTENSFNLTTSSQSFI